MLKSKIIPVTVQVNAISCQLYLKQVRSSVNPAHDRGAVTSNTGQFSLEKRVLYQILMRNILLTEAKTLLIFWQKFYLAAHFAHAAQLSLLSTELDLRHSAIKQIQISTTLYL